MVVAAWLQESRPDADATPVTPSPTRTLPAQDAALARVAELCRALASDVSINTIVLVDSDLRVRMAAGPSWARGGVDPATLVGKELSGWVPAALLPKVREHYEAVLAGETRRFSVSARDDYRTTIVPIRADDGSVAGCLALAWDEGAALRAERAAGAELARRLGQQSAVARLGELALERPTIAVLTGYACEAVREGLGVDAVSVLEHVGEDGTMRVRAATGFPDGFVGSEFEMRSFAHATGRELYANGPVVIDDLPNDPRWRARPLRAYGVVSSASVLLGEPDTTIGLLGAHTFSPHRFSDRDLDFLTAIAHVLNGAIQRLLVEEKIRHDALHDALTGLPNRTLLVDRLRPALATADRDGRSIALFFLDVDHLKVLNDSLGHHAGDELLCAIGPRLAAVLRPGDTVARFGGDEFAILCDDIADEAHALRVADRLVGAFAQPFEVCGEPRFCSTSVGVVVSDPGGPRQPEELLSDADAALYRAKERGRGRHEVFDAGLRARITSRLELEADLRRALESEDQLWVAYQPVYRLPGGDIAAVEALMRWTHPERGEIPPSEFIPVAEDSGLIVGLGELVLRTACREVAGWHAAGFDRLGVTVNVSARQMALSGMPGTVGAILRETGFPADRLGLEITEGLLLEDTPATLETLLALQRLGVRLLLDDFGTGYSSLSYLRKHPVDALKIDRSFVHDLGSDGHGDSAIIEAIVGMAHALGMWAVPEGVETAGQLARLTELGCDFAQGFHLARPLPAAAIRELLARGGR
jgi:diguanylate cyclase (GGDEF)-like protein